MREIGSVADDLDVGGILEGRFIHMAVLGDTYFGEAGATRECTMSNFYYLGYCDTIERGATVESFISNLRYRLGDCDTFERGAISECIISYLHY